MLSCDEKMTKQGEGGKAPPHFKGSGQPPQPKKTEHEAERTTTPQQPNTGATTAKRWENTKDVKDVRNMRDARGVRDVRDVRDVKGRGWCEERRNERDVRSFTQTGRTFGINQNARVSSSSSPSSSLSESVRSGPGGSWQEVTARQKPFASDNHKRVRGAEEEPRASRGWSNVVQTVVPVSIAKTVERERESIVWRVGAGITRKIFAR